MSKNLNGFEALNAPIGTQFEVKYKKGITRKVEVYKDEDGVLLKYIDIKEFYVMDFHKGIDTAEFIPIQQPVSFMEAIANDKNRIKVDLNNNHFFMSDVRAVNNYMSIREMFGELKNRFSDYGISKAIKEGKWYIEESEGDSND